MAERQIGYRKSSFVLSGRLPVVKWRSRSVAKSANLVHLRNRTGEERRRQTLCDKRDNNFVWNNFSPSFTFLQTDLFVNQKTLVLSEDHDKKRK